MTNKQVIANTARILESSCNACNDRTIEMKGPNFGIRVTLFKGGGGEIASNLCEGDSGNEDDGDYDAEMTGIERLILAMATEGIDIETPAMMRAINTAIEGVTFDHL